MQSSVAQVIDRLLEIARALPACQDPAVWVSDGPAVDGDPPVAVIIGGSVVDNSADGTPLEAPACGAGRWREDYSVIVEITAATGAVDQQAVRATVWTIRDELCTEILRDDTLGVGVGTLGGLGAQLDTWRYEQTPATGTAGQFSRYASIVLGVRIVNDVYQ